VGLFAVGSLLRKINLLEAVRKVAFGGK